MRRPTTPFLSSVATVLAAGALVLGVGGTSQAAPPPDPSTQALSCGAANLDTDRSWVVHSCSGTGVVQYTVDCWWGDDFRFSIKWTSSMSSVFPYSCSGGPGANWGVTYTIVR